MKLLTHPDLSKIMWRTFRWQIGGPAWIAVTANMLHSYHLFSTNAWFLTNVACSISISMGIALAAVYGLVHVLTKLDQPKEK